MTFGTAVYSAGVAFAFNTFSANKEVVGDGRRRTEENKPSKGFR